MGLQDCLFNIYVLVLFYKKRDCLDLIRDYLNTRQLENIICGGDLNLTLAREERKGGSIVRDLPRELVEDLIMD